MQRLGQAHKVSPRRDGKVPRVRGCIPQSLCDAEGEGP